jgi:hypothetical protein
MTQQVKSIRQVLQEAHDYIQENHGVSLTDVCYSDKFNISTVDKQMYAPNLISFDGVALGGHNYD